MMTITQKPNGSLHIDPLLKRYPVSEPKDWTTLLLTTKWDAMVNGEPYESSIFTKSARLGGLAASKASCEPLDKQLRLIVACLGQTVGDTKSYSCEHCRSDGETFMQYVRVRERVVKIPLELIHQALAQTVCPLNDQQPDPHCWFCITSTQLV